MDNKLNYTEENEEREDGKLSYRTPIYLQLREIIRNRIEEGEYLPGTAIPSENKLAETYGINRLTVRNAVDALVNEGILRRVQGKGVFVVGDKYEENLDEHGGFVNVMSSGTKRVSIKEQAKIYRPAGNKYANYFNIEPDDLIFCVRHQITLDSEPLAIEDICTKRCFAEVRSSELISFYNKRYFCILWNRNFQYAANNGDYRWNE